MFNKRQYSILSERYFEALLGDFSALAWMVGQAPLIGALIILRWKSWQATETLYFVIALSAVWFGCINSCREIAKESGIYKRERLFGLNSGAYLASKVKILSMIGVIEIGLFYLMINHYLDTNLMSFLAVTALFGLYFSGMSLGLMLSRWCGTVGKAVVAVPIVIIPQIVFSKFVLPENTLKGAALKIEKLMVVKWGFESLRSCKKGNIVYDDYMVSMIILILLGLIFLALTLFHLWFVEEK
ncbi:ABC transporter permease [Desulfobacterales bacterium HSG16]|nr:ABC transporter permease [Desulfobacterales bacterium HSG16]